MIQRKVAGSAERAKKTKSVLRANSLAPTMVSGRAEFEILVGAQMLFASVQYDASLDGWVWYMRMSRSAMLHLRSGITHSFESALVAAMCACGEYRPPGPKSKGRKKTK